ncbi:unnamed protein product [Nezara viridula]|uniref:Uncharacterized protein n=1 Tax=Nezara viridula TaxID=85310 RepID=A0A9P0H2B2_NEZVI|nr:unnamed protein product [Nezara viridula]
MNIRPISTYGVELKGSTKPSNSPNPNFTIQNSSAVCYDDEVRPSRRTAPVDGHKRNQLGHAHD